MNTKPAALAAAGTVLLCASAFPAITVAVCGLAGMTGYQLLLNAGERVVPAGTTSLLVATAPVYASLLAVAFLGERATRRHRASRHWAGSAVALAGTALIAASHGLGFGASALIVLAAAVLQAIFHTAQKPLLARYTGFVLCAYAMARADVGRVTVSLYLVPAAAIGISLVWLGQVPGPAELIGGAGALAGVLLASGAGSGVAAGDDERGRGQAGRRPGQQDQQGPARGEQVRRRVQRAHLLGRLQQREPADPAVPRRRQQDQDARHQDHRDGGGDAARGVPDDRAEGQAEQRAYAEQQAGA